MYAFLHVGCAYPNRIFEQTEDHRIRALVFPGKHNTSMEGEKTVRHLMMLEDTTGRVMKYSRIR